MLLTVLSFSKYNRILVKVVFFSFFVHFCNYNNNKSTIKSSFTIILVINEGNSYHL
jgi:hypothetical protein